MKRIDEGNKHYHERIEVYIDPEMCGINEAFWPVKQDFTDCYAELTYVQKEIITAAVKSRTVGELTAETGITVSAIIHKLRTEPVLGKIIIIARMCQLTTDTARSMYLDGLIDAFNSRKLFFEEVQKVIITDRDHLNELASQLTVDGDGKRGILKRIVAYGMQVKKVEDAQICHETGLELAPMVVALADPRMAFNALQELNRMDHEYGQDDKATSSVEAQADRIRRLRGTMDTAAQKQAKVVGAVAKTVADRELRLINDSSAEGAS